MHDRLNVDFIHPESGYKRYGCRWEKEELDRLRQLFTSGMDLSQTCRQLERPPGGVIPKLLQLGLIAEHEQSGEYIRVNQPKENIMNETTILAKSFSPDASVPTIETVVRINGRDASQMSNADIFRLIAKLEKEVDVLDVIRVPSKKIRAAIESLEEDIKKLAEYVDARA
ncbi:hypothetical protein FDI24_gp226 [Acidovorax phage ACP17]|uniref:Uncharacterized protein n=1 Tax=Acidovorax phage ACP17 TaxID=2010329 RepID=A0A218M392_9CAUD|nr:hypothetical protein FDI24_gp226 [Acidovorax phage ACP17]ASD50507.1 hypothetical protein [Acidovorax phage ACP17]